MKKTRQTRRAARRLFAICLVDGLLDEGRVRQVVARLLEAHGRETPALLSEFIRLVRLDRARHTARVESAVALSPDLRTRLQADLAKVYGPGLHVSFAETPALIAGMRVSVGSDVYDGSVRAALSAIEAAV
jgi:F-type H+-transporting ATPase subunit delta